MGKRPLKSDFVHKIQKIFADYYRTLDQDIKRNHETSTQQLLQTFQEEKYFNSVQQQLEHEGFYLDITPQYGVDTGTLNLETVNNISLRPILSQTVRKQKVGNHSVSYKESILGESLIKLPPFIEPIVEAASPTEVVIFSPDLFNTLKSDYRNFKKYTKEAEKRFIPGDLTLNNLFCVQLKLYVRQWGTAVPGNRELGRLIDLFRRHGRQHVADFELFNSGRLHFTSASPGLKGTLNKDALLEARVIVRQLLERSLPYYVLGQVITYQMEWLQGSRSEYAWAGHILFEGLSKNWALGIEKISEREICALAYEFANRKNFIDMLN